MKKALIILSCVVVAGLAFATAFLLAYDREQGVTEKPVLYIYSPQEQLVTVSVDVDGAIDTAYPAPDAMETTDWGTPASWTVTAEPDGKQSQASGRT